jgi:hypothetical protein
MSEKQIRDDSDLAMGEPLRHVPLAPGRLPASAKLFPGAMLMRKARDANGVATGADEAVARASSSSGAALPGEVRARFESSLGADLSGVRVHTGGASAEAARAVGAKAYTIGNDIHFADGMYAPADPFGLHLLAHEVAHTQQQAGGTPVRQNKLEVSTPGDAAEIEADRAAEAMVAGVGASVSRSASGVYRDYDGAGGAGGTQAPDYPNTSTAGATVGPSTDQGLDPAGQSVPPPAPFDWSGTPPTPSSPTGPWGDAPIYKPEYSAPGNLDAYRSAFNGSWSDAQVGYQSLYSMNLAFQTNEKEVVPLLRSGAGVSIGAQAAHVNATDSFDGNGLKANLKQIDADKVPAELRSQILAKKDTLAQKKGAIADRAADVQTAVHALVAGTDDVMVAINNTEIVNLDKDAANLNLDANQVRRDLDQFKADSKMVVEAVKASSNIVGAIFEPKVGNIVGAVNQTATAGGAIADDVKQADANKQLAAIDQKIRQLSNTRASLQATNAALAVDKAQHILIGLRNGLEKAVRAAQAAQDDYNAAYRDLGQLMKSAGAANKMSDKDQAALAGAVEAIPKIDKILEILDAMQAAFKVPSYSEDSGIGAAMASNTAEFVTNLGIVKGSKDYVAQQTTTWQARKADVEAVIDQSTAVKGTDF